MDTKKLIEAFKNAKVGFVSFPYTNKKNETSKLLVNIGVSYGNAKKKDIDTLDNFLKLSDLGYVKDERYTRADWETAMNELSFALKSPDKSRSDGQSNAYVSITENGVIQWCIATQELVIVANLVRKEVIEEGEYKADTRKPLTIAKDTIRKHYLTTGKYRKYIIKNLAGNIKISGEVLEIE